MKRYWLLTTAIAVLFTASSAGAQAQARGGQRGAQAEAGGGNREWNLKAPWGATRRDAPINAQAKDPFKLFDNVYSVGFQTVSAYLVTTSAGLVLIDSGWKETTEDLLKNIRKAGFDPANIKYVFITHSHTDHYGAAARVKQVSGARVGMSAEDWQSVEQQQSGQRGQNSGLALARDLVIKDGQTITAGDTTFKFYFTPGHTVGATSIEYQVRDGGKSYRAVAPGGMGMQFGPDATPTFLKSVERLKQLGPWDVVLGNHPFLMPSDLAEIEKDLAKRGNGPHPAVLGPAKNNEWFDAVLKTVHEKLDSEKAAR